MENSKYKKTTILSEKLYNYLNERVMLKYITSLAVILIFGIVGFLTKKSDDIEKVERSIASKKNNIDKTIASNEVNQIPNLEKTPPKSTHYQKVEKEFLKLSKNQKAANNIFMAIWSNSLEMTKPEMKKIREKYYDKIKKNQSESFETLKQLLLSASSIDPIDKLRIIDIISQLNEVSNETKELALEIATNEVVEARPSLETAETIDEVNAATSTTFEMAVPIAAHALFLGKTNDQLEAIDGTIKAIVAQEDSYIQQSIAQNYINKYPQSKEQILTELENINISIEMISQRTPASEEVEPVEVNENEVEFIVDESMEEQ